MYLCGRDIILLNMTSPSQKESDSQLWAHFKDGDKEAFTRLYELYVDVLFSYGTKISGDKELVKDCIHEVFLLLHRRRKFLSDVTNIKFYLFKALKHVLLRRIKRESKFTDISFIKPSSSEFNLEYSIEDNIILDEQEKIVREYVINLLKNLNSKQREILYLRFYQGFNYNQISKITGITGSSAKKQVYRILLKLRKIAGKDSLYILLLFLK